MYRQFSKSSYRTKSKYGNKTKTYNGKTYDSIREANHAEELDWRIKAGEIKEVVPQFKIPLKINDRHIANYYIDFKVVLTDGDIEYHEVKGFETDLWRLKWKMTEALYPEYNLILIK
jgi:hypothetical protein